MRPLRLLLSAYACEPDKGSEPGVGWRWAIETARLGHQVVVITRSNNRAAIENALRNRPDLLALSNLRFVYFDLPSWLRWWKRGSRGVHAYYVLWQLGAYWRARRLHRNEPFDAVHHITFGVTRHPSFMGRLGIPFVLGPLGGGEHAPLALRRHFPLAGQLSDAVRDLANFVARVDPFVRQMLDAADVILVKTRDTLAWLPTRYRDKAHCRLEIGSDAVAPAAPGARRKSGEPRFLYVGRFLHWKGMGLGLLALAQLRRQGIAATLTLVGQGPQAQRWRALAADLGIAEAVHWVPWLAQKELLASYAGFDALLFPSLHDSSGNVVLEAMARGLPVVCLELGGPGELVDASCGSVVPVAGRNEEQVVAGLAAALREMACDDATIDRLRQGARARAANLAWATQVARVWGADGLGSQAVAGYVIEKGELSYEKTS
jgi:glycosyltransferase involved in cell wall biosynthesis